MSRISLKSVCGLLLSVAVLIPAASVAQERPTSVRVVQDRAPVRPWLRMPPSEVLTELELGTTLEVLDREDDWFWVILPPDAQGTRKPGWIRARDVEPAASRAAARQEVSPAPGQRDAAVPATSAVAETATLAEDKVVITARRDDAASSVAPTNAYKFEDVHFDRNRSSLREEDMAILRAAVTALKADPLLTVKIEGHTCSLGTPAYNQALGGRRADAVKTFLIAEGIAADRLQASSLGEHNAVYDNSREDTRRLNRRVALVPGAHP